jgi:soluble cytochrome b562
LYFYKAFITSSQKEEVESWLLSSLRLEDSIAQSLKCSYRHYMHEMIAMHECIGKALRRANQGRVTANSHALSSLFDRGLYTGRVH